ncbi:MAG: oxygen-dependent coproporphyrinogen oxidase [Persicimonas sp.]
MTTNFDIRTEMTDLVFGVQDDITTALGELDGNGFREDEWERPGGGGGRTRVLQGGDVFEKAGVGVSVVEGKLSPEAAKEMGGGAHIEDLSFWATGVSLVIHPDNPMAPTVHANYRYFERGDGSEPGSWWFGGGCDLTPAYLFEEDCEHFHRVHKEVCDRHDADFYPRFKEWCDEYFYVEHREEARGVGGIFFDDLHEPGTTEELFSFVSDCAHAFLPAYLPIIERRKDEPFEERHRRWQRIRRGRYVEFNLVYDRGTKFGLRTKGRIESILMSLPLEARWEYEHHPEPGSDEARMLEVLEEPRDWV